MTEQTVTILPRRRSIIPGATARATRNALVRFTSRSSRHSSSENCSRGLRSVMPALLTRTSTGPSRATPAATASSSVTSNGAATAPSISAARASAASAERPLIATRAPAAASARASARPSPRVEPVTSAVRPVRSNSSFIAGRPAAARATGTPPCGARSAAPPPCVCRCRRPRRCSGCARSEGSSSSSRRGAAGGRP